MDAFPQAMYPVVIFHIVLENLQCFSNQCQASRCICIYLHSFIDFLYIYILYIYCTYIIHILLKFTNVVPYLGTCTLSPGYKKQIVDPIIFEPGEIFTDSRGSS